MAVVGAGIARDVSRGIDHGRDVRACCTIPGRWTRGRGRLDPQGRARVSMAVAPARARGTHAPNGASVTRGGVAQWQSSGLISRWSGVQISPPLPISPSPGPRTLSLGQDAIDWMEPVLVHRGHKTPAGFQAQWPACARPRPRSVSPWTRARRWHHRRWSPPRTMRSADVHPRWLSTTSVVTTSGQPDSPYREREPDDIG